MLRTPCSAVAATLILALMPQSSPAQTAGNTRVENEFKLSVPDAELEAVRAYLAERYGTGTQGILGEFGSGFTARISDEFFVDRYFDTAELELIAMESGVRCRQRWNLTDPEDDAKHGRQLLQLKLRRPDDPNLLNRTEVKFDVDPPARIKEPLDEHPVLGLVDRDERPAVIAELAKYDVAGKDLRPTITLEQRRWRVYVSRGGEAYATLTLDEVSSRWLAWKESFVELEIELNEILYTEGSPEERAQMQLVSQRMSDDIREAFPSIVQDQTPKYNKVYDAFSARIPAFATLVVHGRDTRMALMLAGIVLLAFVAWIVHRIRRRPHETEARETRRAVTIPSLD